MIKDINEIYKSVAESSYGLSLGAIWQHISVECSELPDNYSFRKKIFFVVLGNLLNNKKLN